MALNWTYQAIGALSGTIAIQAAQQTSGTVSGNMYYFYTTGASNGTAVFTNGFYTANGTDSLGSWQQPYQPYQPAQPLTVEQIRAQEAQREEWAREREERDRKVREERERAEERAQKLIEEILAEDEFRQLKQLGYVDVPVRQAQPRGEDPNKFQGAFKSYRIRANAGVYLVDHKGKESGHLCIHTSHPDGFLPPSDDLLCKWFTAKYDEERLWAVANYSAR